MPGATKLATPLRTLVRHSAYGYGGDPQFARGLETRAVTTEAQRDKVREVGGVLLSTFGEAEARAEAEMYPEGAEGITPQARGTFAKYKLDGLAVYVPPAPDA